MTILEIRRRDSTSHVMKFMCWKLSFLIFDNSKRKDNFSEQGLKRTKCRLVYPVSCAIDRELCELLKPFLCNEEHPSILIYELCECGEIGIEDMWHHFRLAGCNPCKRRLQINSDENLEVIMKKIQLPTDVIDRDWKPITLIGRRLRKERSCLLSWLLTSQVLGWFPLVVVF